MNESLHERFPDMQPITAPPALTTVNGIGMSVYGKRDYDAETTTYVKTQVFCVLFIPLFCMKAFRVKDAPQGWYFIGRVPLSALAKAWNVLVILLVAAGIGVGSWAYHTNTPDYKARKKLEEADQLAADGKIEEAAKLYRDVATGSTSHAYTGQDKLLALLDSAAANANPEAAAKVLRLAVDVHVGGRTINGLFEKGRDAAKKHADADPRAALAMLDAVEPLTKDLKELLALRRPVAEAFLAKHPADPDALSEMAMFYEEERAWDKCEKLLAGHDDKLGDREGTRILGMVYLRQKKLDEAHRLVHRYAEPRLQRIQQLEQRGHAGGMRLSPQEQLALRRDARAVGAILDLGIGLLEHGQQIADADKRRQELERAEKTLLTIANVAGREADFLLSLGQVYYWLGKHAEGQKQFDEFLAGKERSAHALYQLALILRNVGAVSQARSFAEEAYEKEMDTRKKQVIAGFRSVVNKDVDDRITWLNRGDPNDLVTQADLNAAQAEKAAREGKDQEAIGHYRKCIELYGRLPEDPATLNNGGLAHLELYLLTGDADILEQGFARMEKALQLRPQDSILISNVAMNVYESAVRDMIGKRIDLRALKMRPQMDLLSFLYSDRAGLEAFRKQLGPHPAYTKARSHFQRWLVLAPRNPMPYIYLSGTGLFVRDAALLRELDQRLRTTKLDAEEMNREALERYKGKKDDKRRGELAQSVQRYTEALAAGRKVGGPTLAVAASKLIESKMALDSPTEPADVKELARLADEAEKASPSIATLNRRVNVHVFRAHRALLKDPAYATFAKKAEKCLGSGDILALAIFQNGPAKKACLDNADVRGAQKLIKERVAKLGDEMDEWTWVMLRDVSPADAERIRAAYLKNEPQLLAVGILRKIAPLNAESILRDYWGAHMAGNAARANELVQQAISQGVPLPFETKK